MPFGFGRSRGRRGGWGWGKGFRSGRFIFTFYWMKLDIGPYKVSLNRFRSILLNEIF